jgi:hypothetical protein
MTTNNQYFIQGKLNGRPATYERKTAEKKIIDYKTLWQSDLMVFGSKIGLITNYGTSFFAMLSNYDKDSEEYKILQKRLLFCNAAQNMQIDKGKGILVIDIPKFWGDWSKIDENDSDDVKADKTRNNKLITIQRPYFFRYVYAHQNKKYLQHIEKYDEYSKNVGETIGNFTGENIQHYYTRYSPLFDSDSVMNRLCRHMEVKVKELGEYKSDFTWKFNVDKILLEKIHLLYIGWKQLRNKTISSDDYDEESVAIEVRKNTDMLRIKDTEIAKMALMINSHFAFSVFGEYVVRLFKINQVEIPVLDVNGDIEYLGNKYGLMSLEV